MDLNWKNSVEASFNSLTALFQWALNSSSSYWKGRLGPSKQLSLPKKMWEEKLTYLNLCQGGMITFLMKTLSYYKWSEKHSLWVNGRNVLSWLVSCKWKLQKCPPGASKVGDTSKQWVSLLLEGIFVHKLVPWWVSIDWLHAESDPATLYFYNPYTAILTY